MARVQPLKTALLFESAGDYEVGMWANESEIRDFMKVFIIAATILNEQQVKTPESKDGCSVLNGLAASYNDYLLFKSKQPIVEKPTEVTANFGIFPLQKCSVMYEFQPLNNVSTEILMYSWDEIRIINNSLTLAKSIVESNRLDKTLSELQLSQNEEMGATIENIVYSFSSFVVDCDPLNK